MGRMMLGEKVPSESFEIPSEKKKTTLFIDSHMTSSPSLAKRARLEVADVADVQAQLSSALTPNDEQAASIEGVAIGTGTGTNDGSPGSQVPSSTKDQNEEQKQNTTNVASTLANASSEKKDGEATHQAQSQGIDVDVSSTAVIESDKKQAKNDDDNNNNNNNNNNVTIPLPSALSSVLTLPLSLPDNPFASLQKSLSALPPTPFTATNPSIQTHVETQPPLTNNLPPPITLPTHIPPPPEYPIKLSPETLRLQINLVLDSLLKLNNNNWIAHSCLIAQSIDRLRLSLEDDLGVAEECEGQSKEFERVLTGRGYTISKIDAFVIKVLNVLDGIAAAEETKKEGEEGEGEGSTQALAEKLQKLLEPFPVQTKETMESAGKMMEYLRRGKEFQEKKRLDWERRVKVMEGMAKIGDVVGGVVRYLLTEA